MAHDTARRLRQLQRVLTIIELLSPLREGATAKELTNCLQEDGGQFCKRTIRRDLDALEELGLIECHDPLKVKGLWARAAIGDSCRWVWIGKTAGARVIADTAEQFAEEALSA